MRKKQVRRGRQSRKNGNFFKLFSSTNTGVKSETWQQQQQLQPTTR